MQSRILSRWTVVQGQQGQRGQQQGNQQGGQQQRNQQGQQGQQQEGRKDQQSPQQNPVQQKLQQAEQQAGQGLLQELSPKVQQVLRDLIKAEGIGLLLQQQAVIHADAGYSITAKVTDKLNQMPSE